MKIQIKITTTYHYAHQNGLKLIKSDNSRCWQECEETVILMQSNGSLMMVGKNTFWKTGITYQSCLPQELKVSIKGF